MAKIWLEAYGCSASFADSEMIAGLIINGGHTLAQSAKDSDLNLIVTCSVKDATANKMVNRIKNLKVKPLVVAGCLPKAEKFTVKKISPKASMLGPNSLGKTLEVINYSLKGQTQIELEDSDLTKIGLPKLRINSIVGIIEIASGCKSECSFCQTKISKGDLKSYRVGDIVRQVKHDVKDGCKEIWLTSTDNGCYGLDIGTDLPNLINEVCDIDDGFKVRIGMMNPMYMARIRSGLLRVFENDKVFKFLHIPVQSGSDRILKAMERGHTSKVFRDTIMRFREKFGLFSFSTDIIVGFPTETIEDFEQTIRLIEETMPDVINLSKFSARPGTKAARMKQIEVGEVKRRSKKVYELSKKIALERNESWVGWKGEVLFDETANNLVKGRNFAYKPVVLNDTVSLGEMIEVEIIKATQNGLLAKKVS